MVKRSAAAISGPLLYPIPPASTPVQKLPVWSPIKASTLGFSITPSSIIASAPAAVSSEGWKISLTAPFSALRWSVRILAAPRSIEVWASCPQACMRPLTVEAKGRPVSSWTGRASISALIPSTLPGRSPRITAATPFLAIPVRISVTPISFRRATTKAAVSAVSNPSSGCACRWRRHSTSCGFSLTASSLTLTVESFIMVRNPPSKRSAKVLHDKPAGLFRHSDISVLFRQRPEGIPNSQAEFSPAAKRGFARFPPHPADAGSTSA